jgi:hypothetical protein
LVLPVLSSDGTGTYYVFLGIVSYGKESLLLVQILLEVLRMKSSEEGQKIVASFLEFKL